ncbi:hypothetical protein HMPREF1624_04755 [Sporothrix schenckii ATCC 58251]|uniref:Choline kinase N-terminal domain-containing protein n=1 Tax=Sporothrix schenckii (strain ATCC 58251 / de Perez 2211183) TaxID=1391915 RepID=U7PYK5_SPOS1|nr:hypothetical protein HMPREF1624_04755 [Sporothrix schenckii ATCC 58251]
MSNPQAPTSSPRSVPLRSALRDDSDRTPPLSGLTKAVQIAEPDVTDVLEPPPVEELPPRKQFTVTGAKRLSGRAAVLPLPASSRNSVSSQTSLDGLATYMTSPAQLAADDPRQNASPLVRPLINPLQQHHHQQRHRAVDHISGRLLAQISEWIQHERIKKETRKSRKVRAHGSRKNRSPPAEDGAKRSSKTKERRERLAADNTAAARDTTSAAAVDNCDDDDDIPVGQTTVSRHHRAPSTGSASSDVSLDRLQRIIDDNMSALGIESISNYVGGLRIGGGGGSGLSSSGISNSGRRHSRTLRYLPSRTASSDTEYMDGDVLVPGCDAVLDNSKTLKYSTSTTSIPLASSSGRAASDAGSISSRREDKERQAWYKFKNEIIRLAHTLRLKGWRKVPLDAGETITVERLSGALTNAVYVVSPPADLGGGEHSNNGLGQSQSQSHSGGSDAGMSPLVMPSGLTPSSSTLSLAGGSGKTVLPNKLLLRIYGPQVEHLIDREKELSVLRRLGRKKIGPRLLGTFANGRFEQFFKATTLTAANLREPETSKQIAKRMRELHDGVELLEEELDAGPTVWRNWDRWLDTVEATITFLDREVRLGAERERLQRQAAQDGAPVPSDAALPPQTGSFIDTWKSRGYVCGVEWPKFKALLEKHREMVKSYYGGSRRIRDRLIFAHNDTQYGNILRIRPDERSPLLQPENEHKQLIVIDFEYASANLPGNEFANHFTEWTYNYHDSVASHVCFADRYPTPEQQRRFIRAYVDHRPEFPHQCASSTPRFGPMSLPPLPPLLEQPLSGPVLSAGVHSAGTASAPPTLPSAQTLPNQSISHTASSASSIVDFMLDARAPPGGWMEEERRREELLERQVDELMEETRLWRAANSAMWVAWGIVQAKVPGFSLPPKEGSSSAASVLAEDHDDDITIDGEAVEADDATEPEEEFDYLGYAQERAFFVLGDCIKAGLLQLDELPADVQSKVKMIDY